jgi:hypothetical protein
LSKASVEEAPWKRPTMGSALFQAAIADEKPSIRSTRLPRGPLQDTVSMF